MNDYNEYDEELTGVTYFNDTEEILVDPGDILINSTATNDDIIELIEYLMEDRNISL